MAKYLKIATSGEMTTLDSGDKTADLAFLYENTGSEMIQMIVLDGVTMWLDEEGKLRQRAVNQIATQMFWDVFGPYSDVIVGDVVITADEDEDGNLLGFSEEQISKIKELALS